MLTENTSPAPSASIGTVNANGQNLRQSSPSVRPRLAHHSSVRRIAAIVTIAAIGLSACANASTDSTPALSGSLAGAGASSQEAAMEAWKAQYTSMNPDVTVSYDAVGSGAGITQFTDGQVSWAGSDAPLKDKDAEAAHKRCNGPAWSLPVYISPVAIVFNLPGIDSLNLDAGTIAKIFRGDITMWNDPAIAASNPGVSLPAQSITPVHRADKSGTTENFTDYLHAAAPEVWTEKPSKEWPIAGGESGDKTSGLIQAIQAGEGTIGYADASQAGGLGMVALGVADGGFVALSPESAATAADTAHRQEGRDSNDLALDINRVPEKSDAYPLVMVSYSIVCSQYADPQEAALVKSFIGFQVSQEAQQAAAENAGSAPLGDTLRSAVEQSLAAIK